MRSKLSLPVVQLQTELLAMSAIRSRAAPLKEGQPTASGFLPLQDKEHMHNSGPRSEFLRPRSTLNRCADFQAFPLKYVDPGFCLGA